MPADENRKYNKHVVDVQRFLAWKEVRADPHRFLRCRVVATLATSCHVQRIAAHQGVLPSFTQICV